MSWPPDKLGSWLAAQPRHVHLTGVGGVGMAGLAHLLHAAGHRLSGSEVTDNPLLLSLRARGIAIAAGHAAEHLPPEAEALVYTPAVSAENPELQAARTRDLPFFRRGLVLPAIANQRRTLAVCGTHGKTTTSSMLAFLLRALGLDSGWCIGGLCPNLGEVAAAGDDALLVVEADESDGTLAHYRPELGVITNIEFDHMEHFADTAAFEACFARFIDQAGLLVFNQDDAIAARLARSHPRAHGFDADSFVLPPLPNLPGRHNRLNAKAALTALAALGEDPRAALPHLADFCLPDRRFQLLAEHNRIRVISDYAHHPTEIRAVLDAARPLRAERLIAVFQPHRYTRTLALGADFPAAFDGLDHLVLPPVYAASEPPLEGGRSRDLFARMQQHGRYPVTYAENLEIAWEKLRSMLRCGDVLLVIGAGDVCRVAEWAKDWLEALRAPAK